MDWISRHADAISALTSIGTLAVWAVYLHVFVGSYHRKLRASLILSHGPGPGLEARCLLSNMSAAPVFVASVQVTVTTPGGSSLGAVTSALECAEHAAAGPGARTIQGPLTNGEIRDIGGFAELVHLAAGPSVVDPPVRVAVEVVGFYGPEDLPVGARRTFQLEQAEGGARLVGLDLETHQVRSRRERRSLLPAISRDR